ncbi:MAG: hydantoinase/oxoprolinase family protein, partial [Cyanobacteria bacterium J06607_6]
MKLISRGDTTVVDAYLSPILRRYVDRIAGELQGIGNREQGIGNREQSGVRSRESGVGSRKGEIKAEGRRQKAEGITQHSTLNTQLVLSEVEGEEKFRIPNSEFRIRLMFMQSNGGLTDAALFQGKDSILSGPAGGIVGAVQTSLSAGFEKIIGFDMGGTSTAVVRHIGR